MTITITTIVAVAVDARALTLPVLVRDLVLILVRDLGRDLGLLHLLVLVSTQIVSSRVHVHGTETEIGNVLEEED
jgi:hypothetical protein